MVSTFQLIVYCTVSSNPSTARDPIGLLSKALNLQVYSFVLGMDFDSLVSMLNVKMLCNKVLAQMLVVFWGYFMNVMFISGRCSRATGL